MSESYDIVIIGGGPAGLTAAIYAARAGKKVKVIDRDGGGGQIVNSPLIENFPGAPSVRGSDLALSMVSQALDLNIALEICEATSIRSLPSHNLLVETTDDLDREVTEAKAVIIATGARHKHLNVPGERKYLNAGVHYCAMCDGPFYAGRDVLVVGSGNSGAQYALEMAEYCSEVTICDITPTLCCEKMLADRIKAAPNIHCLLNARITEVVGDDNVATGVVFSDGSKLDVSGIFVAIGQEPDTEIFRGLIAADSSGYLKTDDIFRSSMCGVFVAGDCRKDTVRQAIVAAGEGAAAAVQALRYLGERKE